MAAIRDPAGVIEINDPVPGLKTKAESKFSGEMSNTSIHHNETDLSIGATMSQ